MMMSDNRTTELLKDYAFALRRLEYDVDKPGSNMTLGEYEAEEKRVTEEYAQAIAATVGNGTLTAEQVMVIAGKHQPDYCSDTHVCFDWQAIADELNAMMGNGTCKLEKLEAVYVTLNMLNETSWGVCSECGTASPMDATYCCECGRKVER